MIGKNEIKSLHIAPMLDVSGREFRQLIRILSRRAVLWTEMVVDTTIIHTQEMDYHLDYERENSHPIICQIGGNSGCLIRQACTTILGYEYSELNVNLDCPSNRVAGKRQFGAVLMKQPKIAESVVLAMLEATKLAAADEPSVPEGHKIRPISVKCRIGVDEIDTLDDLIELIGRLKKHCKVFYIHARKAILGGVLNPAQNRSVPPLDYPRVYRICKLFPDCDFYINGGIKDLMTAKEICYGRSVGLEIDSYNEVHGIIPCIACGFENGSCTAPLPIGEVPINLRGCMLGRIAMDNPCLLWDVDRFFYGEESNPSRTRREILEKYCKYLDTVYPRRCCDRDPYVTCKITDPKEFDFVYDSCHLCAELSLMDSKRKRSLSVAPTSRSGNDVTVKVATIVMDRCIKPINNIFYGLPKAKLFRQEVNRLARDLKIRNCGPSALIVRALCVIPDELLDQELISTEDMFQ